jgi:hypothetical protein
MLKNLREKLEETAIKLSKDIKNEVTVSSGELKNSVSYKMTEKGFFISAFDYIEFIDKGVNGILKNVGSQYSYSSKKPPIKSLKGWSKRKGLNPYAVQNNIFKYGRKPKRFLRKAYEEFDVDSLALAYGKDIEEEMFNW